MAFIAHVETGVSCDEVACAMTVCVLFVCSRSGIVFNPSAGAFADHSQSANDINPYFKSLLYLKDPHRSVSQIIIVIFLK